MPKVAELLPNAVLIKPESNMKLLEEELVRQSPGNTSKTGYYSQPKKIKSKHEIFQTPSMKHIPEFPAPDFPTNATF